MKILRPAITLFVLLAISSMNSTVDAQVAGGSASTRGSLNTKSSLLYLFRNPLIKQELMIDDEQLAKIAELDKSFKDSLRESFRGSQAPGDIRISPENMRSKLSEILLNFDVRVEKTLSDKQRTRAKQLQNQMQLASSVVLALRGSLGEKLGVTTDTVNDVEKKAREVAEWQRKEIARIRKEAHEKVLSALPDEKRKKLKEMTGESFDFGEPGSQRGSAGSGVIGGR